MVFKARYILISLAALVALLVIMYHAKWTVTGRVIDADTGEPIQGAVIAIDWWEPQFPPGLAGSLQLEVGEDVSDSQGRFNIPKYCTSFGRNFRMAVYKKGYVCWSSIGIFQFSKERYGVKTYEKRKDFIPEYGMQIKLEPFRSEYSKEDHALFAVVTMPTAPVPLYSKAIESEMELAGEATRRRRGE